jgi:hypothetical protein
MQIEPSADSRMVANDMHDQFQAFIQTGFTRAESLHLTAVYMMACFGAGFEDLDPGF